MTPAYPSRPPSGGRASPVPPPPQRGQGVGRGPTPTWACTAQDQCMPSGLPVPASNDGCTTGSRSTKATSWSAGPAPGRPTGRRVLPLRRVRGGRVRARPQQDHRDPRSPEPGCRHDPREVVVGRGLRELPQPPAGGPDDAGLARRTCRAPGAAARRAGRRGCSPAARWEPPRGGGPAVRRRARARRRVEGAPPRPVGPWSSPTTRRAPSSPAAPRGRPRPSLRHGQPGWLRTRSGRAADRPAAPAAPVRGRPGCPPEPADGASGRAQTPSASSATLASRRADRCASSRVG